MVGEVETYHVKQVHICAGCSEDTIYLVFAFNDVVEYQWVGLCDVAVYCSIVNAVAVCVVGQCCGCTFAFSSIKYPRTFVVSRNGRLHYEDGAHEVALVGVEALNVLVPVAD